jgi:glycosyltransferase involved in cell wall biosynthesis
MKIAFIDCFGMPYDGDTLNERGLGGSETAVISMAKELVELDYEVFVFNSCNTPDSEPGNYEGVSYIPLRNFDDFPGFDIVISVRSVVPFIPDPREYTRGFELPDFSKVQDASLRVLWRQDTLVEGDELLPDLIDAELLDEVWIISDWHKEHTLEHLGILEKNVWQTRNGMNYYEGRVGKEKNCFVWNAAAYKGLDLLLENIWPKVRELIPDAQLVVIGGYYSGMDDDNRKTIKAWQNEEQYVKRAEELGIIFTGVIKPEAVAYYYRLGQFFIYPPTFPETYGISTLEAQAYGCIPITYNMGALETIAHDGLSFKSPLPPKEYPDAFVATVYQAYHSDQLENKTANEEAFALTNSWNTVALAWHNHFEELELTDLDQFLQGKTTPMEKKSILIAIPTAVRIECETFKSIYDLKIPEGYKVDFQFFWCYMIDQGRNVIANYAIQNGYDYVLAIDADIEVPEDALVKMLAHNKDMVAGIYRMRREEQIIELYDTEFQQVSDSEIWGDKLIEVGGAGFGCVLVKTKVFEDVGYPQFFYHQAYRFSDTSKVINYMRIPQLNVDIKEP